MLNPAYEQHWQHVAAQLHEQGYVLLNDILTSLPVYGDCTHQFRADKYSYDTLDTPVELTQALGALAQQLGYTISEVTTRRYQAGDFTLQDTEEPYEGVELVFIHAPTWQTPFRGELTYTRPEQQPLLVGLQANTAVLVKRDAEMRSFIKRITHYAESENAYVSVCTMLK